MNCLKCGCEVEAGAAFCGNCLADMEKNPVKPGTKVQLPQRPDPAAQKKAARRRSAPSDQEQILRLKHRIVRLHALVLVLALVLAVILFVGYRHLGNDRRPLPGQNYSTVIKETEGTDVSHETIPNP